MSVSWARGTLAAALLASTSLVAGALPAEAQAVEAVAVSPELAEALAKASFAGDASLVASVYENVRLTPFRGPAVVSEAKRLQPALGLQIETAARLATDHVRLATVAAPLAGAPSGTSTNVLRALPPGADANVNLVGVSEFDRNYGVGLIGTQTALDKNLNGQGVVVAVVDSGIDRSTGGQLHSEFTGRLDPRSTSLQFWFDPRLAIAAGDVNAGFNRPANATEDPGGHGTHVAGIIGAARNNAGMMGVASGATILSIQALGSFPENVQGVDRDGNFTINGRTYNQGNLSDCGPGSVANADDCGTANAAIGGRGTEAALNYLATQKDVRVINGSFGPNIAENTRTWQTGDLTSEANAVRAVLRSGQIFAVAAGNDGQGAPISAESPTGIGLFPFISPRNANRTNSSGSLIYTSPNNADLSDMSEGALAAAEQRDGTRYGRIIVVVATDANKQIAGYSNRCGVAAEWCIAAPGGAGDANTGQREIYSTYPDPANPYNGYKDINGTSMATPHVAGAVAVLIQAFPTYTPAQITNILFLTAEDLGAAGTDPIYGRGFLRLDRALNAGPTGLNAASTGTFVTGTGQAATARTVWAAPVASAGGLQKEGDGELNVAGNASFARSVQVEDGELQVDGDLTAPDIVVDADGELSGDGQINGNVTVGGTYAPGSSPGELTINGDFTLLPGANTILDVDGPDAVEGAGGFDRTTVIGANRTFTAGGTLSPRLRGITGDAFNDFVPAIGQGFVFVTVANGSVAGSFQSLVQPAAGLPLGARFDVVYAPQSLTLVATPQSYTSLGVLGIAQDANSLAVGGALDGLRPAAGTRPADALNPLFSALYLTGVNDLERGLRQAAGPIHVDAGQEAVRSVGRFADRISGRQTDLALSDDVPFGTRLWAVGGATFTGVGKTDVDAYSGVFGADTDLDGATVGGAFQYEHGDLDGALGASADLDSYQGAVYGVARFDAFDLGGIAGLAYGDIDTTRIVSLGRSPSVLSGSTDGFGGVVEAKISKAFAVGEVKLLPSLAVGYRAFRRDGFSEDGGIFALTLPSETFEEGHVTTALAVSRTFSLESGIKLTPTASIAYRGDFLEVEDTSSASLAGRSFQVQGEEIGRHAFVGGLGIEASQSEKLSVAARYDVDLRDNLDQHSISATLRYRW